MICPNCQKEAIYVCKLNDHIDMDSCEAKCFQIIRDDKYIYHYELEQNIEGEIYYLEVYNFGENRSTAVSRVTFAEVVPTYPITPRPRHNTQILKLNYPWIYQTQEELNTIISRLLKLKVFS